MALTPKQQAFVDEYLQCWNASEAARKAGYAEKSARVAGHRLLTNANISAEIALRVADRAMSADEVLIRLAEQARASVEDFTDVKDGIPNGLYLNFEKAKAAGKLGLIKKLKYNLQGYPEIELYDAQAALVHIGKHLGMFTDRQEISGPGGQPIRHEARIEHGIDGATATTIFDILASVGAIPTDVDDAEDDTIHTAPTDAETGGVSSAAPD